MRRNPIAYHGSTYLFPVGEARVSAGAYGPGFYLSTRRSEALLYARPKPGKPNSYLYECDIKSLKLIDYNKMIDDYRAAYSRGVAVPAEIEQLCSLVEQGSYGSEDPDGARRRLMSLGYDGIAVKLRRTKSLTRPGEHPSETYYVIFDPSRLRCVVVDMTSKPPEMRRNPLVYHGSPYVFPIGEARVQEGHYGPGLYFTSSRQQAIDYATRPGLGSHQEVYVHACQVDLKNPIYFHEIFTTHIGPGADEFLAQLPPDKQELHYILERSIDRRAPPQRTIQQLQERGYDGVIVDFTKFGWPRENVQFYVVFDPKSLSCTWEKHFEGRKTLAENPVEYMLRRRR